MSSRTKETAGENEKKDIDSIIRHINGKTTQGNKMISQFKERFGVEILEARVRKGPNRGTHYDFEVRVGDEWMKVEHKGSTKMIPFTSLDFCKDGVQFHNGGCEKYSLARIYAKRWYDLHIASGNLKNEFGLRSDIPSFEDWYIKDCKVQANPNTPFGIELKEKVRASRGPRGSLLEKRAAVNESLVLSQDDLQRIQEEVFTTVKEALEQKDYWLAIHGDVNGEFHAMWYPKYEIKSIVKTTQVSGLDLRYEFACEDGFIFHMILRWGKGAGFSNLRGDLRYGPAKKA